MKSCIMAIFIAGTLVFCFSSGSTAVAYSPAPPLPLHQGFAPTPTTTTTTTTRRVPTVTTISQAVPTTCNIGGSSALRRHGEIQINVLGMVWQRVFRRGKKRGVQTLERPPPDTKKEEPKDPNERWRVMFHNSEAMPERVAKVLARIIPTLDRRTAFELCSRARSLGKVPVAFTTSEKEAQVYCLLLRRQGLTATVEPHTP